MTRRLSLSDGARPSLANTLATCFSTTPGEMTSAAAMAVFERPWAISESTSRSRGVRAARESARRLAPSRWRTTSGSSTVPPRATRVSASTKSLTSATRSLSR
jgi:hypothetical protein